MKTLLHLIRPVVVAVIGAAALLVLSAGTAAAASTSWVYIVFPSWLGNCPGSSVYGIQASTPLWSTNWDFGDDIVYGKVNVNVSQTLSYNLACRRGNIPVGYQPGSVSIKPPAGTRTIFVGPTGSVRYQDH